MRSRKPHTNKNHQINVRFTDAEMEALDEISAIEDRDRAYVIGFFTRFGIRLYQQIGPLVAFQSAKISPASQKGVLQSSALRLKLREEVQKADGEDEASVPAVKRQTHRTG